VREAELVTDPSDAVGLDGVSFFTKGVIGWVRVDMWLFPVT